MRILNISNFKKAGAALTLMAVSGIASAATNDTGDAFYEFMTTVQGWAGGPLGVGLALTMLLIGAGMGVAQNSPMPALSGIGGAALLHWGPDVITGIMGTGAVI